MAGMGTSPDTIGLLTLAVATLALGLSGAIISSPS